MDGSINSSKAPVCSYQNSSEDLSLSQTPPALRRFSSSSGSESQSLPMVEAVTVNASPEEAEQYGSVLLDIVSGTAHWSPEAPRRAITPDRNVVVYHGRARHCKQEQSLRALIG